MSGDYLKVGDVLYRNDEPDFRWHIIDIGDGAFLTRLFKNDVDTSKIVGFYFDEAKRKGMKVVGSNVR